MANMKISWVFIYYLKKIELRLFLKATDNK